jgi:hypothetical protein
MYVFEYVRNSIPHHESNSWPSIHTIYVYHFHKMFFIVDLLKQEDACSHTLHWDTSSSTYINMTSLRSSAIL